MEVPQILIWNNKLSVGHLEIDEDHKKLCKMINRLFGAAMFPNEEKILLDVLKGLLEYTLIHFKREEKLMVEHNYPAMGEHKREHEKLILAARAMQMRYQSGDRSKLGEEVEKMLRDWLVHHILNVDKQLALFLRKKV